MITADQLKDIQVRTDALHRYLDIDRKRIEFEEEQLRTQAPDFWDDPKRAQEQMKKVKDIEKWIKGYDEARSLTEETQLAFDFYKDELVTEEEVDAAYAKALKVIEDLELKNMLRQEEDPMECVMKINSGAGGQNVNKVESGVRLRYQYEDPDTGEQEEILIENTETRDQPKNRAKAMQLLKSQLYDRAMKKRMEEQAKIEAGKKKIEWGSQIRSYVFDDRRVKDHRTNYQTSDVDGVIDGKIDAFIKAYLMEFPSEE